MISTDASGEVGACAREHDAAVIIALDEIRSARPTTEALETIFSAEMEYPQASGDLRTLFAAFRRGLIPPVICTLREALSAEEELLDSFLRLWPYCQADHRQSNLKKMSVLWLLQRGARDIRVERPYCAGRYDVAAEDLRIVVECGHTRIDKLLTAALSGSWKEFVIVPYAASPCAVMFDLETPRWRELRSAARSSYDPEQCLMLLLDQETLSEDVVARCVEATNTLFWKHRSSVGL